MPEANVFFTDAGVFIISSGRTRRGAITDDEPIIALPLDVDAAALGAAVITALEAPHKPIDDDAPAADFDVRVRKATPYRTLAALERGARSEVVDREGEQITIYPTAFTRGRGFVFEPGELRTAAEPFAVGSAMLRLLPLCTNTTGKAATTKPARGSTKLPTPRGSSSAALSTPLPFGLKSAWFAVRSEDSAAVAGTIGLRAAAPATWGALMPTIPLDRIFVSPATEGWVFLLGGILPVAGDPRWIDLLERLSSGHGEASYFATHRVSDYHAWGRARGG